MKRLNIFTLLTSLLALSCSLFAQDENYDAIYQKISKNYTLNADGSMDYNFVKKIKLQSYRSFQSLYGETFVIYNPDYQTLKINEAYTIMADGKKVQSPANAFNEVLPGFAANAPVYNKLREMVITHPGTERGAVLYLDYTIHTKKGFYPALMGNELCAEMEPIKELQISVKVPTGLILHSKLLNSTEQGMVSSEKGFDIYRWDFKNVPAISAEENQKGGYDLYPRLIFSTAKERESLYSGFLKPTADNQQPAVDFKRIVSGIMKDSLDQAEQALKIQEKVFNELRLWPIPLRYAGFQIRSPEETWNSNGGTLAEKALLLVTLLENAGIPAEPVLVIRKTQYDEKIGNLLDIEDILVRAKPKASDELYLSLSTLNTQNLSIGLPERVLVSLDPSQKRIILEEKDLENKIIYEGKFIINDKKQLSGEVRSTFTYSCNPWFSLLKDKSKAKSLFSGFSSSDLKELKVLTTGPVESYAKYTVEKEKPFHKDTNLFFYSLPYFSTGIDSWGIKTLPTKRMSAFEVPFPLEENYTFTISLPDGLKIFSNEVKIEVKNKVGKFIYQIDKDGKEVKVSRSLQLTKRVIEPSDYTDFKALMDHWNTGKYREILFTTK